jgi:hypothetical protein
MKHKLHFALIFKLYIKFTMGPMNIFILPKEKQTWLCLKCFELRSIIFMLYPGTVLIETHMVFSNCVYKQMCLMFWHCMFDVDFSFSI